MVFDSQLIAKVFECIIVKQFTIVRDEDPRDPKLVNDALPDEAINILLCDDCQWLCFYPFDEIVDPHN